jgi:hypothetical protein
VESMKVLCDGSITSRWPGWRPAGQILNRLVCVIRLARSSVVRGR